MSPCWKKALAAPAFCGVVLLTVGLFGTALAQDEAVEAPVAPAKPFPSEVLPRAAQRLTLDLANTGEHLVAVGERGHVLVSNDGKTWAQVAVPVRSTLTAVSFVDAQHGWAVGHDSSILATADGGRSWQLQNFEPAKETAFLDVLFVDLKRGYAVGAFGLFYATSDGGAHWAEVDAASIREEGLYFHSIVRLNDGSLFIAGETGMLGVSADGLNWLRLQSPYEGTFFGALPWGAKGAMVFGLRGNVYVTDDARSSHWTRLQLDTLASFYGGARLPDGGAVLVGLSGEVLLIDSAGHGQRLPSDVSSSLSAVLPLQTSLLIAGESGLKLLSPKPVKQSP